MSILPGDFTKDFWAKCGGCGHAWVVAKYPAPVDVVVAQIGQHPSCPKCGGDKVFVAKQDDGKLLEAT